MTRDTLLKRKRCCGNGCRHCPYGHMNVRTPLGRQNEIDVPVLLPFSGLPPTALRGREAYVLFHSGGKDSYLALLALQERLRREGRDANAHIVLLTTFAQHNGVVGHQQVPFRDVVMEQARWLRTDLLAAPLSGDATYEAQVEAALRVLSDAHGLDVKYLVFGDLHVREIRDWRERVLRFAPPLDKLEMDFPVWLADYADLSERLAQADGDVFVCALGDNIPQEARDLVHVGVPYDAAFQAQLGASFPEVDLFGENGEFHSVVVFENMDADAVLDKIRQVANAGPKEAEDEEDEEDEEEEEMQIGKRL